MKKARYVALALSVAMLLVALTGCSGGDEAAPTTTVNADGTLSSEATDTVNVVLCAEYVSEEAAADLMNQLTENIELLSEGGVTVNLRCISTGGSADPSMQMAGMVQLTTAIAAQEVDVVIADETNAARNARSDAFYALSDLLTADEIAALGSNALSYDMVDEEGEPTGETTPVCGIDLSGDDRFDAVFGDVSVGAFVVANAPNLENSKALMRALAEGLGGTGSTTVQDSGDGTAQDALDAATGTSDAQPEATDAGDGAGE